MITSVSIAELEIEQGKRCSVDFSEFINLCYDERAMLIAKLISYCSSGTGKLHKVCLVLNGYPLVSTEFKDLGNVSLRGSSEYGYFIEISSEDLVYFSLHIDDVGLLCFYEYEGQPCLEVFIDG